MPKEERTPEHIEKFSRLRKKLIRLLDTHRLEHSNAYIKAADELLKDKEGNIDYEKLDEPKIQDKFIDKMIDHYMSKAKQSFGGFKPKDELEEDLILRAYGTYTRGQLSNIIRKSGKHYNLSKHEEKREELIEKLGGELKPTISAHLKDEHINDIIKYTKIKEFVDPVKVRLADSIGLLDVYEDQGVISEKIIKKEPYYKSKKK